MISDTRNYDMMSSDSLQSMFRPSSKEILITNLLTLGELSLSLKKISKQSSRNWMKTGPPLPEQTGNFPNAFVSCDSIFSNRKKTFKNKSNTLFLENPPSDDIVKNEFSKFPGYMGIKSSEYIGKKLCFVTFNSIENAEDASVNCVIKSTFAKNPTRNYQK